MSASAIAFQISLVIAALLCTVVFAWALIFHIVIMPGIALLDDGGFLRAFQVIDGIIQRNQPVFVFTWLGSTVALLVAMGLGYRELNTTQAILLTVATVIDVACQISTFTKNVPLNNRVKELNISYMDSEMKRKEREHFEAPWNWWNLARTVGLGFVSVYLLVLLLITESAM
jgi:hypothetical protein